MTAILILAILALALGLLEIFVLPGFGWAGISAIVCAAADALLIYHHYGAAWALAAILVAAVLLCLLLWYVARARTLDRVALHATIDSTSATAEQLSVRAGQEGTALTRLALVGNASIEGKQVEVKSAGAFIDPGTPIRVVRVEEGTITVEALQPHTPSTHTDTHE